MIPVKQTKLYSPDGIHNGNCLGACYASLLELPLWMVPPFEDMFGRSEWYERIDEWLAKAHKLERVRLNGHPVDDLPRFYIACGRSARGVLHATIYSAGDIIHDPHFSDSGIASVDSVEYLRPLPE